MAREREQRHSVLVRAKLRIGLRRADVCIRNISAHGLMVHMACPPCPGSYVEVGAEGLSVVARVVWRNEHKCGMRTREAIDVAAVLGIGSARPHATGGKVLAGSTLPSGDRARILGRAMDFAIVAVIAGLLGASAATAAYQALKSPLRSVELRLG